MGIARTECFMAVLIARTECFIDVLIARTECFMDVLIARTECFMDVLRFQVPTANRWRLHWLHLAPAGPG